jgi:hypothetical protein
MRDYFPHNANIERGNRAHEFESGKAVPSMTSKSGGIQVVAIHPSDG